MFQELRERSSAGPSWHLFACRDDQTSTVRPWPNSDSNSRPVWQQSYEALRGEALNAEIKCKLAVLSFIVPIQPLHWLVIGTFQQDKTQTHACIFGFYCYTETRVQLPGWAEGLCAEFACFLKCFLKFAWVFSMFWPMRDSKLNDLGTCSGCIPWLQQTPAAMHKPG